ncbi:Kelch-like protein 24 [Varanus komodoensis]|uniref:kelch-like protein 12 n=1 Tax=Varanus komodoensis TaxID=61221 RepID=UPI001CF7E9A7|nr:kelch-like protein 12 [Varanus komodoensis]KAF7237844.1 Kelch-like protein 24 [Varanus komodoensis]
MDSTQDSDEEDGGEKTLQSHETYLCQGLKQLYESQQLCDVTLGVEGRSFPCHRMLLASVSPYFRDIFINSSHESQNGEIQLKDMAASTLHSLLDYLYTEELSLTAETAQDLFTAASKLQILPLKEAAGRFLEMNISMNNCLSLYGLAHQHNHEALTQATSRYIKQHFGPLTEQDAFLSLQHDALTNLISSESLEVSSELIIYQAVRNWVEAAASTRLPLFKELLGHVRFPLLTHEELTDVQADIAEYYRHVRLRWKELDGAGRLQESGGLRKGMYNDYFVCVEVSENRIQGGNGPESFLLCFDPQAEKWEKLPPVKYLSYSGCASLDCKLYLSGGQEDNCAFVDSLYEYNSLTSQWTQLPSMSAARAVHPFLACNKILYALGGCSDAGPLSSAEAFSVAHNAWAPICNLPLALMYPASTVLKSKLYLMGGKATRSYRGLLIYDTNTDWWTEVPMEFACYGAAAISVGPGIYVFGGYTEERSNLLTHGTTATEEVPFCTKGSFYLHENGRVCWDMNIPDLPVALAFACAVQWQGKIYLLAGKDEQQRYSAIYSWAPEDMSWTQCPEEIPATNSDTQIFSCTALKMPQKPIRTLLLETVATSAVVGVDVAKKGHLSPSARDGCTLNCCWGGR